MSFVGYFCELFSEIKIIPTSMDLKEKYFAQILEAVKKMY